MSARCARTDITHSKAWWRSRKSATAWTSRRADDLILDITGPFANRLARKDDNLVLKAARALGARMPGGKHGAAITLEKNLPVAAGLGGGSADAAAALRGLNAFWNLGLSETELLEIASTLGSDVPACLLSRPCWMEGRGELREGGAGSA